MTIVSWAKPMRGFSLVEMMIVIMLIAILAGVAVPVADGLLSRAKADSASLTALSWLQETRNRAISERRNFEITFDTVTNRVQVARVEPDLSTTTVRNEQLEGRMEFMDLDAPDTPDAFGNAEAVDLEGPAPHMFTSDGSFIDANGDPSNGTIFLGRPGEPGTGNAITIFGVTGLTRVWTLVGETWFE
jgi:prepilin-type N-terminal cleavage/methylation domain-containing protein